MKSEKLAKSLAKFRHGFMKHSPEIYTGAGIACGIGALVVGIVGAIRATKKVDEIKEEQEVEKLPAKEVIKHTWPYFIPAVGLEIASASFMLGANSVSRKTIGALSTAYSLSEGAYRRYKEKVVETLGEKKEKEIHEAVLDEAVKDKPPKKEYIIETTHGDVLFFDVVTGQYFTSCIQYVKEVINNLNRRMLCEDYVSHNELAYELGEEESISGEKLGWNIKKGLIDVYFSAKVMQDGRPCVVLEYSVPPMYHYMDM